ncbi:MAG: hypothetical protein CVU56_15400 [Deltaproteobacteria bacterium HGW-Deltaproteobacteria-14]|jgi:hypothetical protein|nr:MAG: hypothetical protein CVU56_15400 [Deltaproteobacteria bacterium HGW-Deltaproteobacteria-14]
MHKRPDHTGGLAAHTERALASLARRASEHPRATFAIAALTLAVALLGASRLRLDADLTHLLPESFASVQALDALQERFGSVGFVVVVGEGADPDTLRRFADDVAPRLEAIPDIRYVDRRRPSEFFEEHALYFLDPEDLGTLRDRVRTRERWERRRHNPMYVDLEDSAPPSVAFSDIVDAYAERSDRRWVQEQSAGDYYLDADARRVVLLARPTHRASDLAFAQRLVSRVSDALADMDLSSYGPDFKLALTGRYVKKIDQQRQIQADLGLASTLALGLVLLYLLLHFRRLSAVVFLLVPLITGLGWTFGVTGFAFGTLNLLTGFVGAILIGLGIDHGVHLVGRYDSERAAGRTHPEAVERAFGQTGRAVVVAGVTTAVAFASVALSEFRAFREFGIVAALGSVLVIVAYTTLLPAALSLLARRRSPGAKASRRPGFYARTLPRWSPVVLWLGLLGAGALATQAPEADFDFDFSSIEGSDLPSFQLDREVNRILGYSQTPVIVLTEDVASERAVATALRDEQRRRGAASSVDFVATVADLVPDRQAEKAAILAEIGAVLDRVKPSWLDDDARASFDEVRRRVRAAPFTRASLPDEVRRQFQGPGDASDVGFVMVFPRVSMSDGAAVVRFAEEVRGAVDAPVAGEAMVLTDILGMVGPEAPRVLGLTLGLGLLTLWLLLGGLRMALVAFGAAVLSLAVTLGLLPVLGVSLNYLNIVVIPVLFGLGVDGAVHMTTRLSAGGDATGALSETARGVTGALLTTAFGFGTLLLADHPGLRSLGALALIGLGVNLLVSVLLVPSFVLLARGGRPGTFAGAVATVGWAGLSPLGPGTLGALVALPIAWALGSEPIAVRLAVAALVTAVGLVATHYYLGGRRDLDPQEVVVDEFVGCLLALAFVPFEWPWILAAFGLFRLLDIFKPWPINLIDRAHRGALSVMGDDVAAGVLAGLILLTTHYALA